MTDKRKGKKASRDYLNRRQVYADVHGNIVMKLDDAVVLLIEQGILWDLKDCYAEDDEFTEVNAEVIIS